MRLVAAFVILKIVLPSSVRRAVPRALAPLPVFTALLLTGCSQTGGANRVTRTGGPRPGSTLPPPQGTPTKMVTPAPSYHKIRGQVLLVTPAYGKSPALFAVAQEDIPGYMPMMSMSYSVRSPKDAQRFKKGDKIRFDLVRHEGVYYIENVTLLPAATPLNIIKM